MRKIHNYYTKLFFVIFITVAIASVFIAGIIIVRNVTNIQSITERSLIASAEQKVKIYEVNINSLHALSKSIGDDVQIQKYFLELKNGREDKELYQSLKIDLEREMKSYTKLLENAFFVYDGICYMDGLGGTTVGFDIAMEGSEWYTQVIQTKKHYLGKLKESPITGLPIMVTAYPILDANGEILAVFALPINLNGFSNAITYNPESTNEKTMVIDESGTVVAANDTDLINTYNIERELSELNHFIKEKKQGITYYSVGDIRYLAAIKKSEAGVTIIQSLPVSVYQNPIIISILISIMVLIGILLCVAGISYLVAKNITKPIHILVTELNRCAAGDFDNEISDYLKNRKDEFLILGDALKRMKERTSQLIMNLNLSNEEVEASLEEVIATEDELKKQNELLRQNEDELRKSNEYNTAIMDVIPDVIFILDKEGTFTHSHVSNEKMLYLPMEQFIGKKIMDVMPEHIAMTGYHKIQTALETGELQSFEYELEIGKKKEIFELRIIKCFMDGVVAIARNITNQHQYQKQIEYLSFHDQLTGLHNRRSFESNLQRLNTEENLPLCIIMADVNGLKLVNDSFGHRAGDVLLYKFAKIIKDYFLTQELLFRVGGDEFVILVPNCDQVQAEDLVNSIKESCECETVNAVHLSVSFGWDIKNKIDEDIHAILKSAEDFMYKKKLFEGPSMRGKTISLIISTLHEKNKREEEHSQRVAELCEKLAISLHMPQDRIKEIKNAGLLHDIGKIAISEDLLNKPGKLTAEEFEEVKRHPEIGYRILCSANEMADIAEHVLSHHERWDGKGYPRGLMGDNISLQARMIAIADTFDAMTSIRSYRDPVSEEEAAKELLNQAGTQFDPELVHCFVHKVLGFR